ncbi:hypothetical protein NBRC10512_004273 [Rhodotorula toruloides]
MGLGTGLCECGEVVETRQHFILECSLYTDERQRLQREIGSSNLKMDKIFSPRFFRPLLRGPKSTWAFPGLNDFKLGIYPILSYPIRPWLGFPPSPCRPRNLLDLPPLPRLNVEHLSPLHRQHRRLVVGLRSSGFLFFLCRDFVFLRTGTHPVARSHPSFSSETSLVDINAPASSLSSSASAPATSPTAAPSSEAPSSSASSSEALSSSASSSSSSSSSASSAVSSSSAAANNAPSPAAAAAASATPSKTSGATLSSNLLSSLAVGAVAAFAGALVLVI